MTSLTAKKISANPRFARHDKNASEGVQRFGDQIIQKAV